MCLSITIIHFSEDFDAIKEYLSNVVLNDNSKNV